MTPEELNTAIYHKMEAEQDSYRDWLLTLLPDEILQHAYEYAVRQDILFADDAVGKTKGGAMICLMLQRKPLRPPGRSTC